MANLRQELLRKDRDVRFLQTGGGKDVYYIAREHGPRDDLADSVVQFLLRPMLLCQGFRQNAPYGLEKAYVIPDTYRFIVWHCERERFRKIGDCLDQPALPILLLEDVLLRVR
jgi:hypothetical protein